MMLTPKQDLFLWFLYFRVWNIVDYQICKLWWLQSENSTKLLVQSLDTARTSVIWPQTEDFSKKEKNKTKTHNNSWIIYISRNEGEKTSSNLKKIAADLNWDFWREKNLFVD